MTHAASNGPLPNLPAQAVVVEASSETAQRWTRTTTATLAPLP
ncbi:MAG: hypothetical protein V7607_1399 [Solirubrobacteraceae bacterium]